MRVLYVNHTSRISGGEISLLTLLKALPDAVEPVLACPEGPLAEAVRAEEIEVRPIRGTDGSLRLHPSRTPQALFEMGHAALQLRQIAGSMEADIVHANSIRAGIIAAGARTRNRPTVVHVRDCLPDSRVSALALETIQRTAHTLIANSFYTRSTLGAGRESARVIHNAVDFSRFGGCRISSSEARARLGLEKKGPVLAVVAQITPWKAQDDAIRTAHGLLESRPNLHLLLVGSPKFDSAATRFDNLGYLESLRKQVEELGIDSSVSFLGQRDDVPEILRAVDLLLVPSWEEPFGRTVIEAMASGVAVAATEAGGPPEILEEAGCGLLLPPCKPQTWIEAIDPLLSSPERLHAMAEWGRAVVRVRFGADRHVENVMGVYEEAASNSALSLR